MLIAKSDLDGRVGALGGGMSAQLDRLEMLISKLGTGVEQPLEILNLMDRIDSQFKEMTGEGTSLQEAEAQYGACSAALRDAAGSFMKEVGGAGPLQTARLKRNPDREAWWWFLDEYVSTRRQAWLRRNLKIALITAVILGMLGVVYQQFFAPDPKTIAVYTNGSDADRLASQGHLVEALAAVEKGLALVPDSPELLIRKGILSDLLGNSAQAAASFARSLNLSKSMEEFYLVRAQIYLAMALPAQSVPDAQSAIAANPQSAIGYMILGTAQEMLGASRDAYASYQKADELSSQLGDTSLTAQIKVKMAYLMQSFSVPSFATPTP